MAVKIKKFLSIEELIENIKCKGIKIKNERKTKEILEHNNYYYISGYKELFKNALGNYKENVYFEDIYTMYQFDKKLKLIFAEVLFEIEQTVKTVFSNNFCQRYGYKDTDLINSNNYDRNNKFLSETLNRLNNQIRWYGNKKYSSVLLSKYLLLYSDMGSYKSLDIWNG